MYSCILVFWFFVNYQVSYINLSRMETHELHTNPNLPQLLAIYTEKQKVAEEIKSLKVCLSYFRLLGQFIVVLS